MNPESSSTWRSGRKIVTIPRLFATLTIILLATSAVPVARGQTILATGNDFRAIKAVGGGNQVYLAWSFQVGMSKWSAATGLVDFLVGGSGSFMVRGMDVDSGWMYESAEDFLSLGYIVRADFFGNVQVFPGYPYPAEILTHVGGIAVHGNSVYFAAQGALAPTYSTTGCYIGKTLADLNGPPIVLGTYQCGTTWFGSYYKTTTYTHVAYVAAAEGGWRGPDRVYFFEDNGRIGWVPAPGGPVTWVPVTSSLGRGPAASQDIDVKVVQVGGVSSTLIYISDSVYDSVASCDVGRIVSIPLLGGSLTELDRDSKCPTMDANGAGLSIGGLGGISFYRFGLDWYLVYGKSDGLYMVLASGGIPSQLLFVGSPVRDVSVVHVLGGVSNAYFITECGPTCVEVFTLPS